MNFIGAGKINNVGSIPHESAFSGFEAKIHFHGTGSRRTGNFLSNTGRRLEPCLGVRLHKRRSPALADKLSEGGGAIIRADNERGAQNKPTEGCAGKNEKDGENGFEVHRWWIVGFWFGLCFRCGGHLFDAAFAVENFGFHGGSADELLAQAQRLTGICGKNFGRAFHSPHCVSRREVQFPLDRINKLIGLR